MTQDADTAGAPLLSVVIATPDASLPDGLAWLATEGDPDLEVLVAADRNAGLAAATGRWVTFPDPRDWITAGYLRRLSGFLRSDAATSAVAVSTRLQPAAGTARRPEHRYALPHRFREGTRVVDLNVAPDDFHLHDASFAVRRASLASLSFDEDAAAFAGAAVLARALLAAPRPILAIVPAARYRYRHHGGELSSVEPPLVPPDTIARYAASQVALLEAGAARGPVPAWLQRLVVHDVATQLMADRRADSATSGFTAAQGDAVLDAARRVVTRVDADAIEALAGSGIVADVRAALLALRGDVPVPESIRIHRVDAVQRLALVRFHHSDPAAAVEFLVDGSRATPVFAKRRGVSFFRRVLVTETIAWLPAGREYAVRRGGRAVPVAVPAGTPARPVTRPTAAQAARRAGVRGKVVSLLRAARGRLPRPTAQDVLAWWASPRLGGRRYAGAWLLIDRDTEAHDNAEHLYRYLAGTRPDINAWFVLNRTSPDWDRLAALGFRLLANGSRAHTLALHNCRHLVSSQLSGFITDPPNWPDGRPVPWKYHFLQHGATQSDISRWINPRPIETLVCLTSAEYHAFTRDGGNYIHTGREAVLTGFPRNDELLRKAAAVPPRERTLVVFMPTWRRGLVALSGASNRVELRPQFWHSQYATNWFGLVNSPGVAAEAGRHGLELVLMAHPNLAPLLDASVVADGVRVHSYTDTDVQEVLARAAVVVTDYSSTAFDAAFIDRPVLYFQFDREEFFGGGSGYRLGYFDYDSDGFGPVARNLPVAEQELVALFGAAGQMPQPYAGRVAATFPQRDGRACERVTRAIIDRGGPHQTWRNYSPPPH